MNDENCAQTHVPSVDSVSIFRCAAIQYILLFCRLHHKVFGFSSFGIPLCVCVCIFFSHI